MLPARKSSLLPILLITLLAASAHRTLAAPAEPVTAEAVMAHAETQAAAEHKNILLTFSASWCGNCRLFERFAADPAIRPILDKAFVFADLDTGERPSDTRHANIPGGESIQNSVGGKGAGFPFLVMLDPQGKPIVDSTRPAGLPHPGNIGYPSAQWEIDWFVEMLHQAAPNLSPHDTASIQSWLTAHSASGH